MENYPQLPYLGTALIGDKRNKSFHLTELPAAFATWASPPPLPAKGQRYRRRATAAAPSLPVMRRPRPPPASSLPVHRRPFAACVTTAPVLRVVTVLHWLGAAPVPLRCVPARPCVVSLGVLQVVHVDLEEQAPVARLRASSWDLGACMRSSFYTGSRRKARQGPRGCHGRCSRRRCGRLVRCVHGLPLPMPVRADLSPSRTVRKLLTLMSVPVHVSGLLGCRRI